MSQENINELNALNIARMVKDDLAGKFIVRYCMQPDHNYGESLENFDMLLTDLEENLISIQWSKRYGTVLVIVSGTPEADKFTDSDGQFEVNKHTIEDILELIKKAFPDMGILTRKDNVDFEKRLIQFGEGIEPTELNVSDIYRSINILISKLESMPHEENRELALFYLAQDPNPPRDVSAYATANLNFINTVRLILDSVESQLIEEAENAGS